jgi:hypothetical protein
VFRAKNLPIAACSCDVGSYFGLAAFRLVLFVFISGQLLAFVFISGQLLAGVKLLSGP